VIKTEKAKTVVRSTAPRTESLRSEALTDRVRESVLDRVVRASLDGLSRGVLDLRVPGGGE